MMLLMPSYVPVQPLPPLCCDCGIGGRGLTIPRVLSTCLNGPASVSAASGQEGPALTLSTLTVSVPVTSGLEDPATGVSGREGAALSTPDVSRLDASVPNEKGLEGPALNVGGLAGPTPEAGGLVAPMNALGAVVAV
ncbi:hypothetical protein O6H91_10G010000 [Diphasiastrum complanatum]|uniref:Uncharacterized protein n=1 Tax=Diphasiastrum complanatum TaxID=34168 RepID=A0ACC2CEF1_DIPCM|nr:hypothetical protein O6H91_10G010000 [Diphasiastrum complanatum]